MRKRIIIGAAAAIPFAGLLALAGPLAASAHVHVSPESAPPGDYATLAFTVPTESATASTVKLEVDFPTAHPFTSVEYQPIQGWKAVVTTSKLATPVKAQGGDITQAVTKVVWTADPGDGIEPGAFQQFIVSAGAVPDTGKVLLPATQTYSDGSVVKWNEPTPASGTEPEHPAPTLYINDTPPADPDQGIVAATSSAAPVAAGSSTPLSSSSSDSSAGLGLGFGIGGLGLGVIALIVAALAYARAGRRPGAAAAVGDGSSGGTSGGSSAAPSAGPAAGPAAGQGD
ncbi:YcnI family protein [Frondihabitans sp. PAMC 28766]|uniref:YcnI family copper-binding membrane protein n=1 Tax=Frondihabitans sp. PAMC 28766 TaxID=1795630 RepID=UPI0009EB7BD6|nr:YcnI family protein [Frondihabitans sp. PAMC 28766]